MRLSIFLIQASSLFIYSAFGRSFNDEDENFSEDINMHGLRGHHGIFKALDWTSDELGLISQLHSTADYHKLMTIVKLKLISSDLTEKEREKIEKFLVRNRPPTVLRKLFSQHDKQKIREFMKKRDIEGVLTLVQERLGELSERDREIAIKYMNIKARE